MESHTTFPSPARGELRAGFTLIELLVVISIIAILASLAFPAVQGAMNSGKKAQARNDVSQIVSAIKSYQAEYGRLPTTVVASNNAAEYSSGWFNDISPIIKVLTANDDTMNPRKIVFLEPKVTKNKKGGIDMDDYKFYDPWGTPYRVKMDVSYDNKIEYNNAGTPNVFSTAIAISYGPNTNKEDSSAGSDDILSFK